MKKKYSASTDWSDHWKALGYTVWNTETNDTICRCNTLGMARKIRALLNKPTHPERGG